MNSSRDIEQLGLGNLDQAAKLEFISKLVPLSELPEKITAPTPSKEMVESVRRFGLWQPVILVESKVGYQIAEGRGRILASRLAGRDTVRADVYPAGTPLEVITLVTSKNKRRNPAADLEAIQGLIPQLMMAGVNEQELYASLYTITGLNRKEIDKVLRLNRLHPVLLQGLKDGLIKPSVAESIARMGAGDMEELVQVFITTGRIQTQHLEELREQNLQAALDKMPELFPMVPDWRSQVQVLLNQMLDVVPEDRREVVEQFRDKLTEISEAEFIAMQEVK